MLLNISRQFCIVAALTLANAAHGTNLVGNASFEDGLQGWSATGSAGTTSASAKDGDYVGLIGFAMPQIYSGTLSQTIPTTVGHNYLLSFWLRALPSGAPFDMSASFGSSAISFNLDTIPYFTYKEYSILSVAESSNLLIAFNASAISGRAYIDAVKVTDLGVASSVPEVDCIALLTSGIGVACSLRRRANRSQARQS